MIIYFKSLKDQQETVCRAEPRGKTMFFILRKIKKDWLTSLLLYYLKFSLKEKYLMQMNLRVFCSKEKRSV